MNIHADWKNCTIEDFAELSHDDLKVFNYLLSDHLCSQLTDDEERKLNTLQAKLLFLIHNTF